MTRRGVRTGYAVVMLLVAAAPARADVLAIERELAP
jgi:hypothetical protein